MKKIIIIVSFICLLGCNLFAKVNIRANVTGGPVFLYNSLDVPFLPQFSINADYEKSLSENNSLAFGGFLGFYFLPFIGGDFSYIHCLQAQSQKNYRWYIEPEIHAGVSFFGNTYVSGDGKVGGAWSFYPTALFDFLFTFKPQERGLYFGAGPACYLMYIPNDDEAGIFINTAAILSLGFRI
ncbi:MAG: hypothetical protein K5829_15505 [Treponema sp.]|nr:hypothetical protein [Treponema sp.]